MNAILTLAATLTILASPAVAAPHAPALAGPFLTNGSPMPPQVFAPEAPARAAAPRGGRSTGVGPHR